MLSSLCYVDLLKQQPSFTILNICIVLYLYCMINYILNPNKLLCKHNLRVAILDSITLNKTDTTDIQKYFGIKSNFKVPTVCGNFFLIQN